MSTDTIEYYDILNVSRDASIDEIKKAFRNLAHKFHPDKNKGDKNAEEKFKEICRAYEVLVNPETRSLYDRTGIGDFNKFNRSAYTENPFSGAFKGFTGRGMGRGCGFGSGRGCGRRFYKYRMNNFFNTDIKIHDILITEEQARKGIEISLSSDNFNPDKTYKIKIPDGIQNGQLIRCIDEENGSEFIIRVNYRGL